MRQQVWVALVLFGGGVLYQYAQTACVLLVPMAGARLKSARAALQDCCDWVCKYWPPCLLQQINQVCEALYKHVSTSAA